MADTDAMQPPANEAVDATVNATVVEPAADQTTPPISKRALKKAKKTALATTPALSAEEESERNIAASIDHPYLSFLHKRIRLYKKKLEKIKALETAQLQDGKKLNDQQAELVASKGLVEKMIAEFESLRGQFIEVFVAEEKNKETQQNANKPTTTEPEPVKDNEVTKAPEEVKAPTTPVVAEPVDAVPRDAFAYVEDLLRTLHAVTLHQALGKDVPSVLDYFSKVVLGTTRPPAEVPFEENLAESLEEATRYLTKSEKIVVQEFTYRDLRTMVEKLGVETKEEVVEVTATVPAVADELPEINFFTDSVLDTEIEAAEPVTEDKENGHAESAEAIDSSLSGEDDRDEEDVSAPVVEAPPPSAIPVPPKSFAAAAASAPGSNKPATTRKPQTEGEDKPRRRPTSRSKPANSNSPRNDNTAEAPKSGGENSGKPRRSRAPRTNDENASATHNVKRTSSAGGKGGEERRPRPVRKPTPPPTQQGTAKVAQ